MTTQNYDTQSQNGISVTSNQNEVEVTQWSESKAYRNGGSACDYEKVTKAVKHPAGWVVDGKFCQYDNKGRVFLWFNTTPSYNSICGCTEYRISLGSCGLVSVKRYFNGEME